MLCRLTYDNSVCNEKSLTGWINNPKHIVLTCSDARIVPELIFHHLKPGQIFIVRTAGCTIDNIVIESIKLAIHTFDIESIIVIGHEDCGAVKATMHNNLDYPTIVNQIRPNIISNSLSNSIHNHTTKIAQKLGKIFDNTEIHHGCYNVTSGNISFLCHQHKCKPLDKYLSPELQKLITYYRGDG